MFKSIVLLISIFFSISTYANEIKDFRCTLSEGTILSLSHDQNTIYLDLSYTDQEDESAEYSINSNKVKQTLNPVTGVYEFKAVDEDGGYIVIRAMKLPTGPIAGFSLEDAQGKEKGAADCKDDSIYINPDLFTNKGIH